MSYIYKARDKHDEEWKSQGQIFAASRPKRCKQAVSAAVAVRDTQPDGLAVKVKTGDDFLDKLIAEMQGRFDITTKAAMTVH